MKEVLTDRGNTMKKLLFGFVFCILLAGCSNATLSEKSNDGFEVEQEPKIEKREIKTPKVKMVIKKVNGKLVVERQGVDNE